MITTRNERRVAKKLENKKGKDFEPVRFNGNDVAIAKYTRKKRR